MKSRIHDVIYELEVGLGLRMVRSLVYLLLVVLVLLLYTAKQFTAFSDAEAMEMAQLARNLAQTGAFTTHVVRPGTMRFLIENKSRTVEEDGAPRTLGGAPLVDRHPDILHPPLYPALLAGCFRLVGVEFTGSDTGKYTPELLIVGLGCLFTVGTGFFILLLGGILFDHRLGLLAMSVYFLSDSVLGVAISGLNLAMTAFLVTAAFAFALLAADCRETGRPRVVWIVAYLAASLLVTLSVLTRYGAIVVAPALALYFAWSFPGGRRAASLGLLLMVAAGLAPWALRNLQVSGRPWGYCLETVLRDSRHFPGEALDRSLAPDSDDLQPTAVLQAVRGKWTRNVSRFFDTDLRTMGEGMLSSFFLVALFYRFRRPSVQRFRWCVLLALVLLTAGAGLFGAGTIRLLYLFWPIVILYGLAFFFVLLDRLDFPLTIQRVGLISLVVFLSAFPLMVTLVKPTPPFPYPPYFRPATARVCSLLRPDEWICSDMPWATAWYGNRNSLLLPASVDEFYRIHDFVKDIDALYLTTLTRNKAWHGDLVAGSERTWYPIHNLRIPEDFPLRQGVRLMNGDQLLITSQEVLKRAEDAIPR
jgi:hypothetical protein